MGVGRVVGGGGWGDNITRQCPKTTHFEKKGDPEWNGNNIPQ